MTTPDIWTTHPYARNTRWLCILRVEGTYQVAHYDAATQQPGAVLEDAVYPTDDGAYARLIAEVHTRSCYPAREAADVRQALT